MKTEFKFTISVLFFVLLSCQYSTENTTEAVNDQIFNMQIIIYPIDNPGELRYKFEVKNDSLNGVDYEDKDFSIATKRIKLGASQIEHIKLLAQQIVYKKPFEGLVTDAMEIRIILGDVTVYHQRDFGRGNEKVDQLLDRMFELLDLEIRIYNFAKKLAD